MTSRLLPGRYAGRLACACLAICLLGAAATAPDTGRIRWTSVARAQLKIDGKIPLKWDVYAPQRKDKKKDPEVILLLLGRRYIALDIKARAAFSVLPSDLHAQGADFESGSVTNHERMIPTSDWAVRDVGPAELIQLTLGDYGRAIEVQLPHPQDLRWAY